MTFIFGSLSVNKSTSKERGDLPPRALVSLDVRKGKGGATQAQGWGETAQAATAGPDPSNRVPTVSAQRPSQKEKEIPEISIKKYP